MSSKRMQAANAVIDRTKQYAPEEGIQALMLAAEKGSTKLRQSFELVLHLGINAKKENVRGATNLPNGTGKTVRIAVITTGDQAKAAEAAGATEVGGEDLIERMGKGELNFDVLIATPDMMAKVGKIGKILGPKGLMPNPKDGTVTADPADAVKQALAGKVLYRNEKAGLLHVLVGHVQQKPEEVLANVQAIIQDVLKLKPSTAKGKYLQKCYLSTSMGPAVEIDLQTLTN